MKLINDVLSLSPTDLANHLACDHLTTLDVDVAMGRRQPPGYVTLITASLRERGIAHENAYIDCLRSQGLQITDLRDERLAADGVALTLQHMRAGADVIVQAPLIGEPWAGRSDVLQKVDKPSALGGWSYEPADMKLAAETKGGTILQLCTYAEMLEGLQGAAPERFHVVTPGEPFTVATYRLDDFRAYYRLVQRGLVERTGGLAGPATYPEPVGHCDICRWWEVCDARRRGDDHLSYIAGISRLHREELVAQGVETLAAAAAIPLPVAFKPSRGSGDTYGRIREQARVQHEQRTTKLPVYELLTVEEGHGLARLPEPSPGDLFLDLEGARYAREGGREYLFGLWARSGADGWAHPTYEGLWAFNDLEERAAFEAVIDRITKTLETHPGAHVYHFGHYEPTVFKRLMGRYATRGEELDELLRAERFVDLHQVVRHALRAGVESYSIKQLEQYYGFTRAMDLRDASAHLHALELALESSVPAAVTIESQTAVQAYNKDDCRSTAVLRDWLEEQRAALLLEGVDVPRPTLTNGEASERIGELEARQRAARERILSNLAPEAMNPNHPDYPRWLFAYLIDWHRREDKSAWWEYYRIRDLPESELLDEPKAIAGLVFDERVEVVKYVKSGKPTGSVIDRYRYPEQDAEIGRKGKLSMPGGERLGDLVRHDRASRMVEIKKGPASADIHPSAVFEGDVVPSRTQQEALLRFCEGADAESCGSDLLFRRQPRLRKGTFAPPAGGESLVDCAVRLAKNLDRTTLAIQGPPGSGKTYVGAQMIRALAAAGKRVGVTAVSHRVIRNLLDAVLEQEREEKSNRRTPLLVGHKCEPDDVSGDEGSAVEEFDTNPKALDAIESGEVQILGGTGWLWARDEFAGAVDVLFVDEAGQMSLANALAISGAASSMVLLGDPQQLEQPQKGSHPDGVDVSALDHVLGGDRTMPPGRGLFLPTTWRLHPEICAFTSELFYEGKLEPRAGLERQRLVGTQGFDGAGLWWCPVAHDGNQNASLEEVDTVAAIVDRLLMAGAEWDDAEGVSCPLTPADLRIVAPYNAQVNRLTERLGARGVPIGTVDKFQGQEAPAVIYSMATSGPEDAPRGMEFLYSLNRLNVATSRARCAAIVVASPKLLSPACRTPRQMQLANALCRYVERASVLELG
ncbi:MAG: TM0106 family RecB-like putative nuclease [Vicinamibacterales bacterium]